ncbi:MAG TPA: HEPN domain-containing protein [Sphingobacteriaceae bacterium]
MPYLSQAAHNHNFLDCLNETFPDDYYDWKITVVFYIAIHVLKAFAKSKAIEVGDTHDDIDRSLNPSRGTPVYQLKKHVWNAYKNMYRYSRTSRYNGIDTSELFKVARRKDYEECLKYLEQFCAYMKKHGGDYRPETEAAA